uniref:ARAD1D11638p n=1 Tax=Blastobotrys adeninivorans TaxID=409370 RepID=A0A060T8I4_BLAAD
MSSGGNPVERPVHGYGRNRVAKELENDSAMSFTDSFSMQTPSLFGSSTLFDLASHDNLMSEHEPNEIVEPIGPVKQPVDGPVTLAAQEASEVQKVQEEPLLDYRPPSTSLGSQIDAHVDDDDDDDLFVSEPPEPNQEQVNEPVSEGQDLTDGPDGTRNEPVYDDFDASQHPANDPVTPVKKSKKITKKDRELAEKETQRMQRGMELAPEAKKTKRFTVSNFLSNFDPVESSSDPTDHSNEQFSSPQHVVSPPTSPEVSPQKAASMPLSTPVPQSSSPGASIDPPSSPLARIKVNASPKRFNVTPKRLASLLNTRKGSEKEKGNDSDSDLEVELAPITKASATPAGIKKVANLAHVNLYKLPKKPVEMEKENFGQPPAMGQKSLLEQLNAKQRQQAIRDREEKIAAVKAKGGNIMTEEEKMKEEEIVESLLEREQRHAEEVRRQEERENGNNTDSENDADYKDDIPSEEEVEEFDSEREDEKASDSESESELEDLFDKPSQSEQTERPEQPEQNANKDSAQEIVPQGSDSLGSDSEEDLATQKRRRRRRNIALDDDDNEDAEDVHSKENSVQPSEQQQIQLDQPTQLVGEGSMDPSTQPAFDTHSDTQPVARTAKQALMSSLNDTQMVAPTVAPTAADSMPLTATQLVKSATQLSLDDFGTQNEGSVSQLFTETQQANEESPEARLDMLKKMDNAGDDFDDVDIVMSSQDDVRVEADVLREQYEREHENLEHSSTPLSQFPDPTPDERPYHIRLSQLDSESEGESETEQHAPRPMAVPKKRKYDRKSSAAREVIDDEAMESEDEWAGLGGASDDDDDDNEGYNLAELVDDISKVRGNEAELRKLLAEAERRQDSDMVNRILEDVTNGGWRKRRKGVDGTILDDFSDEEDMEEYYRSALRMREERRKQRLLEDEKLSNLASNPKTKAFIDSIAETSDKAVRPVVEEAHDSEAEDEAEADRKDTAPVVENTQSNSGSESQKKAKSTRKWTAELIRKSLSFLDEPTESDVAQHQPLPVVEEQEDHNSDDDLEIEGFVRKSTSIKVVDRVAQRQTMITSYEQEEKGLLAVTPRRRLIAQSSKAPKLTKDVEVLNSIRGPAFSSNSAKSSVTRRKKTTPSRILRVADQQDTKKDILKKAATVRASNLFSRGDWA